MSAASDVAVRPSGRDAVTWYAFLAMGYYSYLINIQGNILPFLRDELRLSYAEVSLHTSAIAAGLMLSGLFGDRAVRRFGRQRVVTAGALGSAAAMTALTVAPIAALSIAACLLFGILGAAIQIVVQAVLADFEPRRRDIAIAESNAVACIFATLAPIVTGICVWIGLGWRAAVLAGVLNGILILFIFRRVTIPAAQMPHGAAAAPALPIAYWWYWATLGLGVAVEFAAILWAPAYFETVLGLDPTVAAIAATAVFAGMLLGRLASAALIRVLPMRQLFLAASVTVFVGFFAYRGSSEPVIAIGGLFVIGVGAAFLFPLSLSFAIAAAGPAAARGAARVVISSGLALLLGPPLLGAIADYAGLATAMLMLPVFMALTIVTFLLGESARRVPPTVAPVPCA